MSNYKLTFKLKQHTPIIHFQHDQHGATLRASELKPKLDKYLLTKLGNGDYQSGINEAKKNKWLVGKGEHPALDYKVNIELTKTEYKKIPKGKQNSIPFFFGNMGNDYDLTNIKGIVYSLNNIDVNIFTTIPDLKQIIKNSLCGFFLLNNFGTRQSKGYGSFSVYSILGKDGWEKCQFDNTFFKYWFELDVDSTKLACNHFDFSVFDNVFANIEWFYRSLRSGINYKGLYFKSALYMYLNSKNIQWDKKTIKAHYLSHTDLSISEYNKKKNNNDTISIKYMSTQCKNHNNPDILSKPSKQNERHDLKLWRDLFGLSTEEAWYSYRAELSKDEAYFDRHNSKWEKLSKKKKNIERFKSPILFKPILTDDNKKLIVYFDVFPDNIEYIYNKEMLISIKHKGIKYKNGTKPDGKPIFKFNDTLKSFDGDSLVLPFPDNFDFDKFLDFSFNNIDPSTHIEMVNQSKELNLIKDNLIDIYKQLKNNLQ